MHVIRNISKERARKVNIHLTTTIHIQSNLCEIEMTIHIASYL